MIDCVGLNRRITYIKSLYQNYKIQIKPGEGIAKMLSEAERIVNGDAELGDDDKIRFSIESYHNTLTLAETLETCVKAGWDVSNHLKQITTGTIDYGESALHAELKKIFYKDFECELFIGSVLIKQGLNPELLENPDDPKGDIKLDNIFIEVKHPNRTGQLTKLMGKFNKEMRNNSSYGVFVVGIEDMFEMGDVFYFSDQDKFINWDIQKKHEIENFASQRIIPSARNLPRIIGLAQVSTKIYDIADRSKLVRYGNSAILQRANVPMNNAKAIAKVFNPNPPVFNC